MNNKLSELSKPYGYEYVTAGHGHVVMSRTLPPVDMCEVKPLYSQEYVSAMLVRIEELESKEKARTTLDVRAFSAEMLARADDSDNSLSDDVRDGMRRAAAFANIFIELREVQHG
ncbi:hypothetical protein IBZ12_21460 [Serratia ureilytica]|uniref:hypothetical protein n=1 Tax=Serratia ureilytica TaxID=300181 RepID=UPI0039B690F6